MSRNDSHALKYYLAMAVLPSQRNGIGVFQSQTVYSILTGSAGDSSILAYSRSDTRKDISLMASVRRWWFFKHSTTVPGHVLHSVSVNGQHIYILSFLIRDLKNDSVIE